MYHTNCILCHISPIRRLFRPSFNCGNAFLIPSISLFVTDLLPVLPVTMRSSCKCLIFLSLRIKSPTRTFTARLKPISVRNPSTSSSAPDEAPTGDCTVSLLIKIKTSPSLPHSYLVSFQSFNPLSMVLL